MSEMYYLMIMFGVLKKEERKPKIINNNHQDLDQHYNK